MEEIKETEKKFLIQEEEDASSVFNLQFILSTFIINWKWFFVSIVMFMGLASIYMRYKSPVYVASASILVKDEADNSRPQAQSIKNAVNLGIMTNSAGFDNELELLKSKSLAIETVNDLKLYVNYKIEGRVKDHLIYRTQPVTVDMDMQHLNNLTSKVNVEIERTGNKYNVSIKFAYDEHLYETRKEKITLPAVIRTKVGIVTVVPNGQYIGSLDSGKKLFAEISNPTNVGEAYANSIGVEPLSKTTTIASISIADKSPQRAIDYLRQLSIVYNRQANEDKNALAIRTEEFINTRIAKIDNELGNTDGAIESYKRRNNMVSTQSYASNALDKSSDYEEQLTKASTQIMLLNTIFEDINRPGTQYQTLPSNVGLTDQAATSLINEYNKIVLERNRLLRTASEMSPAVQAATSQLDDLLSSIRSALIQARRNQEITRSALSERYSKFTGQMAQSPEQERVLTQIGRQQEVKSGLYLMLLQKREENSISIASTADKGKLIDEPSFNGKVSPNGMKVYLIALIAALLIPMALFMLIEILRFRIEGHEDVARITRIPIIADVAIASDTAKERADIVVHENKNNQMEEVFRSMRTNLQFMLKEDQKVMLFTSTTSGEGKTFIAANLAVSFALLGKKVLLVGLDIRRPRLSQLFEIHDRKHGITNLLTHNDPSIETIEKEIISSGVNDNLDLLMAGPVPPNPTEIVSRESLDNIFNNLRKMYDYIVVDTAPIGLVSDTMSIARIADLTAYIARADYTPKASILMLNKLASEEKLPNVSIIINGIDMTKRKYGYAYGYGRYGNYGKYGRYSRYGYGYGKYSNYGRYGRYGNYGAYGAYGSGYNNYSNSHYGNPDDDSIKK